MGARGTAAPPGGRRYSDGTMKSERASVCPLDCPDTCSLTVTVEGCESYMITVDSYAPGSVGDFLLTVTETP